MNTISTTVVGSNLRVTVEVEREQTIMENTLYEAAKHWYYARREYQHITVDENGDEVVTPFDELTLQQQLDVVLLEFIRHVKGAAHVGYRKSQEETTKATVDAAIGTMFI